MVADYRENNNTHKCYIRIMSITTDSQNGCQSIVVCIGQVYSLHPLNGSLSSPHGRTILPFATAAPKYPEGVNGCRMNVRKWNDSITTIHAGQTIRQNISLNSSPSTRSRSHFYRLIYLGLLIRWAYKLHYENICKIGIH